MLFVAQSPPPPPPVEIRLASTSTGEVHVTREGYILVLRADSKGQPMVIYPRRPAHDGHVAAGATVKLRSTRAVTWVAVLSDRPFDAGRFAANTCWSVDSLRRMGDGSSVEALVGLARRMAGDAAIAYSTAGAAPVPSVLATRARRGTGVVFPPFNSYYYLSPMEFSVRRAKFQSGAPPAVCNGSVCAQSVMFQLGNIYLRSP